MTLLEIKERMLSRMTEVFPVTQIEKDIQKFFTSPKSRFTVVSLNESAGEENNLPIGSVAGSCSFGVLLDFRNLKENDDALALVDDVISCLHGLKISPNDSDIDRLQYTGHDLTELKEDSGEWVYKIVFKVRREILISEENI